MNTYELADGMLVGTQAEAKSSGQTWALLEIPNTSKPDLIAWLNDRRGKTVEREPIEEVAPAPAPAPVPTRDERPLNIEEAIWSFNLNQCLVLFRVLTHRVQELFPKEG